MHGGLAGNTWDAVIDVSGFVQVAGQSDMERLVELLDGNIGRYVFVSSIMAYEPSGIFPWFEDGAVRPDPPTTYGGFKVMVERLVLDRHAATGFPGTVVRPAAIYGPNNNIFDMEAAMFLRLLQGRPVLVPHDGLVVNSYGHVDDLAVAIDVHVHPPGVPSGEIFNISAEAITTGAYVDALAAIVGKPANVVMVPDSVRGAREAGLGAPVRRRAPFDDRRRQGRGAARRGADHRVPRRSPRHVRVVPGQRHGRHRLAEGRPAVAGPWDFEWEAEVAAHCAALARSGEAERARHRAAVVVVDLANDLVAVEDEVGHALGAPRLPLASARRCRP